MKLEEFFTFNRNEYMYKLRGPDYDNYKLLANIKQKERAIQSTTPRNLKFPGPLSILATGGISTLVCLYKRRQWHIQLEKWAMLRQEKERRGLRQGVLRPHDSSSRTARHTSGRSHRRGRSHNKRNIGPSAVQKQSRSGQEGSKRRGSGQKAKHSRHDNARLSKAKVRR